MVCGIYNTIMTVVSMDKAGRIVLPKEIRNRLHLVGGDLLELEMGSNEIHLRPQLTQPAKISRSHSRVIWDAPGADASIEEIDQSIQRARSERDFRVSGLYL